MASCKDRSIQSLFVGPPMQVGEAGNIKYGHHVSHRMNKPNLLHFEDVEPIKET